MLPRGGAVDMSSSQKVWIWRARKKGQKRWLLGLKRWSNHDTLCYASGHKVGQIKPAQPFPVSILRNASTYSRKCHVK